MLDRQQLLELLRDSSSRFTGSFRDLRDDQLGHKTAADRWSILETAEHVTTAERGSGKLLRTKLTIESTAAEVLAGTAEGFTRIDTNLKTRDRFIPAPDFVMPKGRWNTAAEIVAAFEETRSATIDFIAATDADLDLVAAPHPVLGPLTGTQWAYFLVRHTLRHIEQIDEVKVAASYPR